MWTTTGTVIALVLALQAGSTGGCSSSDTPAPPATPTPSPSPTPGPSSGIFTTRDGVRFRVETVASGLDVPWAFAIAPDGRLFVTERAGRVRIVNAANAAPELALTVDDVLAQGADESGLMGLALDPQFASNRWVYVQYTAPSGNRGVNRIVRYREAGGRLGERAVLLDNITSAQGHAGGRLRFGPDGMLYATTGDGGNSARGQDLGTLAGKILRINRDGTTPSSNPFGSPIYSYGHRNPQGLDWHPATGDLWATEHGATGNDEINAIRPGLNYGWDRIEGTATMPGMESPAISFSPAIAPSGASFYRGQPFPLFANNFFVATLRGSRLFRLTIDTAARRVTAQEPLLDGGFGRIRDVILGPDGFLYFSTSNRDGRGNPIATDDRILRLVPAQ